MKTRFRLARLAFSSFLFLVAAVTTPAAPADAIGGGWLNGGVLGQYYPNTTWTGTPAFARRDVRINFNWGAYGTPGGSRSPAYAAVGRQNFSVKWTGQLMPRFSESYTFSLVASNSATAATLYLWPTNSSKGSPLLTVTGSNSVAILLTAGQTYNVEVDYSYATTGTPVCQLFWSSPSTPSEVLDTATMAGLNVDTYGHYDYQLYANAMDGARDEWGIYNGGTLISATRDPNGWPTMDATNIVYEGASENGGNIVAGTYLLQFQGRAAVYAYDFSGCALIVSNINYGYNLPFGTGYNAASNLTTATLVVNTNNAGILYLGFSNTRRNPGDSSATGVANVMLMRPVSPGSTNSFAAGTYFYTPFETAAQRFTELRWIINGNTGSDWRTNKETAAYSTHNQQGLYRYWEYMVTLANESGKDLMASFPVAASNAYLTNVANLIAYGSDGINPYTSPQANPAYPPLNPNLRVILEHANEVWNTAYGYDYGNNVNVMLLAYTNSYQYTGNPANSNDWDVVNYDGAFTSTPANGWLRWHILRAVRCSDIFRGVFGNAAMGFRVRMLYEYQYDNANNTASSALTFLDNYFNNADGTNHVATPYPVNHYFWGGGGAVYFGSGDANGTNSGVALANSSFETPALAAGAAVTNPAAASWTFTGNAGIYSAAALTNAWNVTSLGSPAPLSGYAAGCQFTVGASPVQVTQLGRWVFAGNSQTHTVYLLDSNQNTVASVTVATSGATTGQFVYASLSVPVTLSANSTYYLVSTETSDTYDYNGTTVTPVAGLTVNYAVLASSSGSPSSWSFNPYLAGSGQIFGPVNMVCASAPVGVLGNPPTPSAGSQAAFIQGAGTISQIVNFPSNGWYALAFQSASAATPNYVAFYFDTNSLITPNGTYAYGPTTNQWTPGAFNKPASAYNYYSTYVFQVTNAGPHTLTIQGIGYSQYGSPPPNNNAFIFFDQMQVVSATALFNGGIPGTGQANGQVGSSDYIAQLNSQARYAQAYGLQVVAYEGGWSIGGDFGATVFQNWCKFYDPRAATANLSSLNTFAQSGSRYYTFGTYETWPGYGTVNAGSYPLVQAVDTFNATLPPAPVNGLIVPNVLTPAKNKWYVNATPAAGTLNATGGWFDWNILAPASGNFVITPNYQSGAGAVLEVDGTVVSPGTVVTNFLTQGLHTVKLRSTNGTFTVTSVTVTQIGAPNAPTLNTVTGGNNFAVLNWTGPASGPAPSGYLIEYGTASGNYTAQISAGTSTNWAVTNLNTGVAYYFVIVATNAVGYSLPSNELSTTPGPVGQLQNLLVWDFLAAGGHAASDGNTNGIGATAVVSGMNLSTISPGNASTQPQSLPGAQWNQGAFNCIFTATNTLAGAVNKSCYFAFTVTPASGAQASLNSISYVAYHGNNDANATMVLAWDTNSLPFFFNKTGYTVSTNTISGSYIGATNTISLAGISALQNLSSSVQFRLFVINPDVSDNTGLGEVPGTNLDLAVAGSVIFPLTTPTFSPPAGSYGSSQSVTISCLTPGSTIYYTTDGSTPTTGSTLYAGPVTVSTSGTLKAIAYQTNYVPSAVASAAYTITSVPVVVSLSKSGANLQLTWPGGGALLQATNLPGPWTTNLGATSPYTVSPTNSRMFYRIQTP
jgi:hypothetical protein